MQKINRKFNLTKLMTSFLLTLLILDTANIQTIRANAQEMQVEKNQKSTEKGSITVKYVDIKGKEIIPSEQLTGNIGDEYTVIAKDIPGYRYNTIKGGRVGKFTDEPKTVTVVYDENGGAMFVDYIDTNGNKISSSESFGLLGSGSVGDMVSADVRKISGYTFKEIQAPNSPFYVDSDGDRYVYLMTNKEQLISVVYTKNPVPAQPVTVKYVDTKGKEIAQPESLSGNVGDSYTATKKDVSGYTFKEVQGAERGKFTDQAQTVTYVYNQIGAPVTVKYLDTNGKEIAQPETLNGNVGDNYTATKKDISGYTFKEVQGAETGKFTDQAQTVTYVYNQIGAPVTVKYVDTEGKEIAQSESLNGNVGDSYTATKKNISGYTFKEVQGAERGKFTDQAQTVTYVYNQIGAPVTVKYVDTNGKEIAQSESLNGNVGDNYTANKKDISGYTFKEVQGAERGKFTDQDQTVTYVYNQIGAPVTVKYVDTEGKEIAQSETLNGNVGDNYTATKKDISGYTFKEIQGSEAGKFTDQAQTVTYVYRKNAPISLLPEEIPAIPVNVEYLDEKGNKISDSTILTGHVGDSYETVQKNIKGYQFKEIQGKSKGVFVGLLRKSGQVQTVKYIYVKINKNSEKVISDKNEEKKISPTSTKKQSNSSVNKSKILPKTGENQSFILVLTGISILALGILFSLKKVKI